MKNKENVKIINFYFQLILHLIKNSLYKKFFKLILKNSII